MTDLEQLRHAVNTLAQTFGDFVDETIATIDSLVALIDQADTNHATGPAGRCNTSGCPRYGTIHA